jgi:NADPH:quinone reductase-like Zn-dependent oxidoreductase
MSFEQAAAAPIAAITALQALRDEGKVQAGQKVLINGASGGVGTFAIQLAKLSGAEVTAVCSGRNAALVRSLGADQVIDYNRQDVTRGLQHYDLIIDTVGTHTINEFRRVLTPQGTLVIVGAASAGHWIGGLSGALQAMIVSPFVSQKVGFFLAKLNHDDLDYLGKLMADGKLVPVIDRRYTLAETAEALRYVEAGHSRGKVVIAID